jgi:hypothetical protein
MNMMLFSKLGAVCEFYTEFFWKHIPYVWIWLFHAQDVPILVHPDVGNSFAWDKIASRKSSFSENLLFFKWHVFRSSTRMIAH